jgi:hypothetical protein
MRLLDLLKPAWQHGCREKRLNAIDKITDETFLKEVALKDSYNILKKEIENTF